MDFHTSEFPARHPGFKRDLCIEGMERAGLNPEDLEDGKKFTEQVLDAFKRRMTASVGRYNKTCTIFYNAGHIDPSIRDTVGGDTNIYPSL